MHSVLRRVVLLGLFVAVPLAMSAGPAAAAPSASGANPLVNGGFECPDGAGTSPAGWIASTQSYQATMTWDSTVAHSGRHSVRIDMTEPGDVMWSQTVPVEPRTTYRLTGWIRTRGVISAPDEPQGGAYASFFGEQDRSTPVLDTRGWTQVGVWFTTSEQTQFIVSARLGFWGGTTTGTAWFDDFRLDRFANDRIVNAGFEVGAPTALPWGWNAAGTASMDAFSWDPSVSRDGHASARLDGRTTQDAAWTQVVQVRPHTLYRLSGWIRTADVADGEPVNAGANLCFFWTWDRSEAVLGTSDWTYVSVVTDSGDQWYLTVAARLGYWSGTTTGTAWFDDLRLEALT